jgi:membrane associated rhomboid family serine protease
MAYNNQNNYYRPSLFGGFHFFPPVIKALLLVNGSVFIFQFFFLNLFHIHEISLNNIFERYFALLPLGAGFLPWQLITYQFMHGGFLHLLFNMLPLWMFGMELENIWGSKKFLIYYLLCGVVAGLANLFLSPLFTTVGPTVGASGAIYAVLIAFAMLFPDRMLFIIPFPVPIKAKYFVIVYIALEIISVGNMDGVAHIAHLGGAAAGFLYIYFDRRRLHAGRRNAGTFQSTMASAPWSRPTSTAGNSVDAKVYDINESKTFESKDITENHQKKIDAILDKISNSGYQSLTEEEKKTLFEASKRMN